MASNLKKYLPLRGYNGCDVVQETFPDAEGKPMPMLFMRFQTVEAMPGGRKKDGATQWLFITPEALEGLAAQLTSICESIRQIEAGADPDTIAPGAEGVTVGRLPNGPTN